MHAIVSQIFLDGLNPETAKAVILNDPSLKKTPPDKAQQMATQEIDRVWEEMDLQINKVLSFVRKKASQKGKRVGEDRIFESKNYILRQSSTSISIEAKDQRGVLLSSDDQGYTLSGFSRQDLQRFETWMQRSKERQRSRSRQSRDIDFGRD